MSSRCAFEKSWIFSTVCSPWSIQLWNPHPLDYCYILLWYW